MPHTWHDRHRSSLTAGQRIADSTARLLGSWPFILAQTGLIIAWITLNLIAWIHHWDPYPFILLNLMFSVQAAYAAPIIMMSQNRSAERDRFQAQADYDTNVRSEEGIRELKAALERLEREKLDPLLAHLGSDADARP